jgi:hypothetical protein
MATSTGPADPVERLGLTHEEIEQRLDYLTSELGMLGR